MRFFSLVALSACSPEGKSPPEGGEETGLTPPVPEVPLATGCDTAAYAVTVLPDGNQQVETPHFLLTVDAASDAVDFARMLEAARVAFTEDVGAAPPDPAPLEVVLYADQAAWIAGLAERGIAAPTGAGGYYDPGTGLASLFRQPTIYFTQMLFLHEVFHQHHDQSRTRRDVLPTWYVEGLAEWVSRHDWDGECLAVGADPRATLEDAWAQVAAGLAADGSALARWVADDAFPGRPQMMAFVHQQERTERDAWRAFREGLDFGEPVALTPDDEAWQAHVAESQEPMTPVWLEWVHLTPTSIRALSPGVISIARYKALPAAVSFEAPLGVAAQVGGVLGWSDDGFDVVFVDGSGGVSRWIATSEVDDWSSVGQLADPGDTLVWSQTVDGLTLNGEVFEFEAVLPPAAGYVVYDGDLVFSAGAP